VHVTELSMYRSPDSATPSVSCRHWPRHHYGGPGLPETSGRVGFDRTRLDPAARWELQRVRKPGLCAARPDVDPATGIPLPWSTVRESGGVGFLCESSACRAAFRGSRRCRKGTDCSSITARGLHGSDPPERRFGPMAHLGSQRVNLDWQKPVTTFPVRAILQPITLAGTLF